MRALLAPIRSKRNTIRWIVCVVILIIIGAAVLFILRPFSTESAIGQSNFSLDYTVTVADPEIKILDVAVQMDIRRLSEEKTIYLYRANVDSPILSCTDDAGAPVAHREADGLIAIGPIADGVASVRLQYDVRVGREQSDQYDAIPYALGDLYSDLLVFSGENVLIMPLTDVADVTATEKYIDRISFRLATAQAWQSIMPYQTPLDSTLAFSVDKPTWGVLNNISKSAFCFGSFDEVQVGGETNQDTVFYIDQGRADTASAAALEALAAFANFYSTVFGGGLGERPFVLLRNSAENNAVILGGVGGQTAAISIGLRLANDCEVLSRTFFHAYFDSKIKAPNLRYARNSWLYDGLADYYVAASADFLPSSVVTAFSVSKQDSIALQYLRYLYFSLKEPGFLALNPSDEEAMYAAQREYYMSTKVPLMIDFVNYTRWQQDGQGDGFIKALVERCGEEKNVDVDQLMSDICGSEKESFGRYFSGAALLPNYHNLNLGDTLSAEEILAELTRYEQLFAELFREQNISYPYDPLLLLNEAPFNAEAAARGARYNTDEIQALVRGFSSVLDRLLMQYAMRGQLAGIDDITEVNIKGALYEDEAIRAWQDFCDTVGYETEPAPGY